MIRSTDRILCTHAGALPRDEALTALIRAQAARQPVDQAQLEASLRSGVVDSVRKQVENRVDSLSDGELSKANFMHYVTGRVSGISLREYEPGSGPVPLSIIARDRTKFPDYFSGGHGGFASGGKEAVRPMIRRRPAVS